MPECSSANPQSPASPARNCFQDVFRRPWLHHACVYDISEILYLGGGGMRRVCCPPSSCVLPTLRVPRAPFIAVRDHALDRPKTRSNRQPARKSPLPRSRSLARIAAHSLINYFSRVPLWPRRAISDCNLFLIMTGLPLRLRSRLPNGRPITSGCSLHPRITVVWLVCAVLHVYVSPNWVHATSSCRPPSCPQPPCPCPCPCQQP